MVEGELIRSDHAIIRASKRDLEIDLVLANDCDIAFCLRFSQRRVASERCCVIFINTDSLLWQNASVFDKAPHVQVLTGREPVYITGRMTYFVPATFSLRVLGSQWQLAFSGEPLFSHLDSMFLAGLLQVKDLIVLKTACLDRDPGYWRRLVERFWFEVELGNESLIVENAHYISRSDLMSQLCDNDLAEIRIMRHSDNSKATSAKANSINNREAFHSYSGGLLRSYSEASNAAPAETLEIPTVSQLLKHHTRLTRCPHYQYLLDSLIGESFLPGVLFDEQYRLLHVIGNVTQYLLEPKHRDFMLDVRQLLIPEISPMVNMVLGDLFETKSLYHCNLRWCDEKGRHVGDLLVQFIYLLDELTGDDLGGMLFDLTECQTVGGEECRCELIQNETLERLPLATDLARV